MPDWFDQWKTVPWGIGGDATALRCPKADDERPDKTPGCFIEVAGGETTAELRAIAAKHRKTAHKH